jgi:hypothetical protein
MENKDLLPKNDLIQALEACFQPEIALLTLGHGCTRPYNSNSGRKSRF